LDALANPLIGRDIEIVDPDLHQHAEALLDQVLQIDPTNLDALLAKITSLPRESPQLQGLYETIARAAPDDPEVLLNLVEQVYRSKNFVKRCLDRIVRLYPMNSETWVKVADKYYGLGLTSETVDCLKNATLVDPNNVHVWLEVALLYRKLGQDENQLACVLEAWKVAGNANEAWTKIYYQLKQLGELEAAYQIPADKLTFRIEVSLKDFIQTGQLGPIRLGMTRQEIYDLLGEPDGWTGTYPSLTDATFTPIGPRGFPLWAYGPIEFYFGEVEQRLYTIYTDHLEWIGKRGKAIKLDGWLFEELSNINHVRDALRDMGISYKEVDHHSLFGQLVLENNIIIGYEYEGEHKDQVSVLSITDETYDDYQ
jgi:tetratricopeptide (TPR) repeat protein